MVVVCCLKGVVWRGVVEGEGFYGVCSVCLTGSLSCQQWGGITGLELFKGSANRADQT